jgi:hypothetical protein
MVSFLLGLLAYPAHELECPGEVVEADASLQLLCAVALKAAGSLIDKVLAVSLTE